MTSPLRQFSGPLFVPESMEDLALLTDLFHVAGDPLSVLFAVASHLQRLPCEPGRLAPAVLHRVDRSLQQLARKSSGA